MLFPPSWVVFCVYFILQAEFDSPKKLLRNEQGMLRSLVDGSGDREALFELARSKSWNELSLNSDFIVNAFCIIHWLFIENYFFKGGEVVHDLGVLYPQVEKRVNSQGVNGDTNQQSNR